jgi:multiple sugar transport system ATP-binding protein
VTDILSIAQRDSGTDRPAGAFLDRGEQPKAVTVDAANTGPSKGSVSFSGVTKRFGSTVALNDLSLDIAPGELLVIVGPSGCGKTTALRIVAGLEQTTEGHVLINGEDVTNVRGRDRNLAMVFQSYALYPHLTVENNIAFGLRQRRVERDEIGRRVREVARMLELGDLLKRKPGQLSGGQRQRVALGRAIVRQTDVLLMDEPLSNLDAQLRQRARAELAELHHRIGSTVLYVTHDQVEAMTMGSRVAVMRNGVLQQCDTPQAIYEMPVNQFVATFIGSPPMNLLHGFISTSGRPELFVGTACKRVSAEIGARVASIPRVLFGIRPEQFLPVPVPLGTGGLDGITRMIEPLGSDQFVTVELTSGERVTARLNPQVRIRLDEPIALDFSTAGTHLFHAQSELREATIGRDFE